MTGIILLRILLAAVLGGIVGLERESRNQPAGLRTHILVGIGSCSFMILSLYGFEPYLSENQQIDLTRIPSYVISGIGFLGAGTIIVAKGNVKGLTTAASIWTTTGIGLAVGIGMYELALIITVVVFLCLSILTKIINFFDKKGK